MATNVLNFHRFDPPQSADQASYGTVICAPADIRPAAMRLAGRMQEHGLRTMVWPDLSTLCEPTDADGNPLNAEVFGWQEEELVPWRNVDRALRSPLLRAARVTSEPFWISRSGIRSRGASRLLDQIDLLEFEHAPAPHAAIVIPVHMPLGQIGAAILSSADAEEGQLSACFTTSAGRLAAPVWQFVTGYACVSRDERYLPTEGLLTTREIECLSWVAHGKTDYEISIILGCSHAGVRYHVTRACAKLGAVNRAQSVFRAAQLGYLGVPLPPRRNMPPNLN